MTGSPRFLLSTVPSVENEERYADERGRYLEREVGLREKVGRALGYRELGYSHSGIASRCAVTESTVTGWMDQIADRFDKRALGTRPQSNPVEVLE